MVNSMKPGLLVCGAICILLLATTLTIISTIQPKMRTVDRNAVESPVKAAFRAEGVVKDINGIPVPGIKVYAVSVMFEPPAKPYIRDITISGKDGRFVFKSLPRRVGEWEYDLVAYLPDRYLGNTLTHIHKNIGSIDPRTVDDNLSITAFKLGSFSGRVVDRHEKGLGRVTVSITHMMSNEMFFRLESLRLFLNH